MPKVLLSLALCLATAAAAVGLLLFAGDEPDIAARTSSGPNKSPVALISNGMAVDLASHAVPGAVTMFDFTAEWCGPCKKLSPHLVGLARRDPSVFLREIDIQTWNTPVAQQFELRSIPAVWIYDPSGRLVARGLNNFAEIESAVARAKSPR